MFKTLAARQSKLSTLGNSIMIRSFVDELTAALYRKEANRHTQAVAPGLRSAQHENCTICRQRRGLETCSFPLVTGWRR